MIRDLMTASVLLLLLAAASPPVAGPQDIRKVFDHYEAIRLALATDTLKGVSGHAAALASLMGDTASADAKKAAELVAAAADLKAARQNFGLLSAALLQTFEKAHLADVYLYTCSEVNQSWAQRGKPVRNPYMGKAMSTCGVPAKPSK